MGARVVGMNLIDDHVRAFLDPFFQDILLRTVLMAATSSDEQDAKWFRRGLEIEWRGKAAKTERTDCKGNTTIGHTSVVHPQPKRRKTELGITIYRHCLSHLARSLITGAPLFTLALCIGFASSAGG